MRRAVLAFVGLAAGGCIRSEPGAPSMCETSEDCDRASGEVCDEGVCYGDPPAGRYAAILVPPQARGDLALTELPALAIAADGAVADLRFAPSVAVTGRVLLACPEGGADYPCGPDASIAARLTITRGPGFPGGPSFGRQVVATAGAPAGVAAFEFRLPLDPEATYQVTIAPEASEVAAVVGPSPIELAPPRQVTIVASADQAFDWVVGDPADLKRVHGCVQNQLGNGRRFAGMRVTALGRWTSLSELERASSQATTDVDGCFTIRVPIAMRDAFDVLVKPVGTDLPALRLYDEVVPDPAPGDLGDDGGGPVHHIDPPLLMPNAANPLEFALPVTGPASQGGRLPVPGADVRLVTTFAMPLQPEVPERIVDVTYEAHAVTSTGRDEASVASLSLYPGDLGQNRVYRATVVPPVGAEFAAAWSVDVMVGTAGGVLQELVLERRSGITAVFESAAGEPIGDAPVEARLSSLFGLTADEETAAAAATVPIAGATTEENGRVFMWLDRAILDQPASYDVEVKPGFYAAPRWTIEAVTPDGGATEPTDLGTLRLPEASYARGTVRDPQGVAVPGAELRIYQIADVTCDEALPGLGVEDCEVPATLRGVFAADPDGVVRPVLPDP